MSKCREIDYTFVDDSNLLDYEGRVRNIALMISKGSLTDAAISLAKEFLK